MPFLVFLVFYEGKEGVIQDVEHLKNQMRLILSMCSISWIAPQRAFVTKA